MAAYSIFLHTEDGGGALQTTSEVALTLFGTKASSHEVVLRQRPEPPPGGPVSEAGFVDLGDIDLGDITRVRVRHDDPGAGPGFSVDRIVVRALGTLEEWSFPYQDRSTRPPVLGATEHTLDVS